MNELHGCCAVIQHKQLTTHHPSLSVVLATGLVVTPFECCLIVLHKQLTLVSQILWNRRQFETYTQPSSNKISARYL